MVDLEALEKSNDDRSGTFWSDAKALIAEVRALRARVAELEKAGDAMANRASYMTDDYVLGDMIDAWRALRRPGGQT